MREHLTTFLVVSLVTLTIWLYAEAESLGRETFGARLEVATVREDVAVRATGDFDGRVTLELSGSKSALARARIILDTPLRIEPDQLALPDSDGEVRVRLLDVLPRLPRLAATGVVIDTARPSEISIDARRLAIASAAVRPVLPNVELAGDVTVDPPSVSVRLPRSFLESEGQLELAARPTNEQLARLPAGGPVTIPITLALPDAWRALPGAELQTTRVTMSFSIRSTLVPAQLAAPVQVLLPSIEQNEWLVALAPEDAVLAVEVSGPADIINRLKSPGEGLIAVLALSSDELARGITSKDVGFAVLKGGVPTPLPESVMLRAPSLTVRFSAARREMP